MSFSSADVLTAFRVQTQENRHITVPLPILMMWKRVATQVLELVEKQDRDLVLRLKCPHDPLIKVIEWCSHYEGTFGPFPPMEDQYNFADSDIEDDEDDSFYRMRVPDWDREFLRFPEAPNPVYLLLDVIETSRYLGLEDLDRIACKVVANRMSGKDPSDICTAFGINPQDAEAVFKELKKLVKADEKRQS